MPIQKDNPFFLKLERILKQLFVRTKDISQILFLSGNGQPVCLFDVNRKELTWSSPSTLTWISSLQLEKKLIACKQSVYNPQLNRKEWVYVAPVYSFEQIVYYLVCTSVLRENNQIVQLLELLTRLIALHFDTTISTERIFLKSKFQKAICEFVREGYMTVDQQGVITYLNRSGSTILDLDKEAVIGRKLAEVIDQAAPILSVLETGERWYRREFSIRAGKKSHHLIISALPLFDDVKQIIGAIIIFEKVDSVQKKIAEIVSTSPMFHFKDIVYQSEAMEEVISMAQAAARTEANVLIEGESGTGKELIAQAIHNYSHRADGPFVVIDCSAIPRDLVESELFGYVDGAFTGARKGGRLGKFELSNGGTVFLDEIGEMPLELQAKLLRVLQSRMITRVGGNELIPVDFRVIAATNRRLEEEVENGNFRLDLYYRLNVIHLHVPPLRNRPEDIPLLVEKLMEKRARGRMGRIPKVSQEVLSLLQRYHWPGNVRELENVVERAMLLAEERIEVTHLPRKIVEYSLENEEQGSGESVLSSKKKIGSLQEMERSAIIRVLREVGGNKSLAARRLGLSRSTLYEKLKRYQID